MNAKLQWKLVWHRARTLERLSPMVHERDSVRWFEAVPVDILPLWKLGVLSGEVARLMMRENSQS